MSCVLVSFGSQQAEIQVMHISTKSELGSKSGHQIHLCSLETSLNVLRCLPVELQSKAAADI